MPWGVNATRRDVRSNRRKPTTDSSSRTSKLTADVVRCSLGAAAEKLPVSATAAKARNWRCVTCMVRVSFVQILKIVKKSSMDCERRGADTPVPIRHAAPRESTEKKPCSKP